jgi:hypothetical protein
VFHQWASWVEEERCQTMTLDREHNHLPADMESRHQQWDLQLLDPANSQGLGFIGVCPPGFRESDRGD